MLMNSLQLKRNNFEMNIFRIEHTDDSANKFEIEQMIRVVMTWWIYHISDSISRRYGE